jgi:hypothetical protein
VDGGAPPARGDGAGTLPVLPQFEQPLFPTDGGTVDFFLDGGTRPVKLSWIHIRGNRVIPEDVYRQALDVPENAPHDSDTAGYVQQVLYRFLVKGGYELASVDAQVTPDGIDVHLDEGLLEKVVFTGRLTFDTLRFRLELFIDQGVFNRYELQKQIATLSTKIGLPVVRWSLVPTGHPVHYGPQIESLGAFEQYAIVHERRPYELWFYFQESDWGTGPGIDLRSGYIDGLELGLNYQGIGLLDSRWRIAASGGVGLRYRIADHLLYAAFSRALLEARWYSKKLGPARFGLWFDADFLSRQRKDLDVEDYHQADAVAGADVTFQFGEGVTLVAALGQQWTKVFDISPWCTTTPSAGSMVCPPGKGPDLSRVPLESERVLTYGELRTDLVFDPHNPRWDRLHRLELGFRYYVGRPLDPSLEPGRGLLTYGWFYERYQKVFEFGWHDFWLKSRARIAFGEIQFQDEENLGELLRGVFGTFERKAGNLEFEFRFSLTRDIIKVSVFAQLGAWGELVDRTRNIEALRFGVATGPGFHALILGMFQLDIYASAGFRSRTPEFRDNPFAFGLVVLLNKTF